MIITHYSLDTVDSTNFWAKRRALSFAPDEFAIISSLEQSSGRGRFDRTWLSPKGKNLYLSYAFFIEKMPSSSFFYSQLAALSLFDLLTDYSLAPQIKWPNDLLVNNKKISGILTDITMVEEKFLIVIGIGLNINMEEKLLLSLGRPATSMLYETGKSFLLDEIKQQLTHIFINKFLQSKVAKEQEALSSLWREKVLWMIHTQVNVQRYGTAIQGTVEEIHPDGTLILNSETEGNVRVTSGEIS